MKYMCQTLFDITATGVTGHYKSSSHLSTDNWNRARNQQRNWETITQILSLRAQLFELTKPIPDASGTRWMFEFETESDGIYGPESDPVAVLRSDADGVPMLRELDNDPDIESFLVTSGPRQNIWFAPISINN
jgi:hypothetical protein